MSIAVRCLNKLMDDARAEGYAQAIEDAAKLIDSHTDLPRENREFYKQQIEALLSRGG